MSALPEFRCHGSDRKFVPLDRSVLNEPSQSVVRIVKFLNEWHPTKLRTLSVLDLGCGRGELVAELRRQGVRAFGIEIDPRFVASGRILHDSYPDDFPVLSVVDASGQSVFPNEYFDLVISDQVFEHVADINSVAVEISRVLKKGGRTCHQFPGRFRFREPHYLLPIVHWLPKTAIRKLCMKMFLKCGFGRQFFPTLPLSDRLEIIFKYSVEETFYRSPQQIALAFEVCGFKPTFEDGIRVYAVQKIGFVGRTTLLARLVAEARMMTFTATKL